MNKLRVFGPLCKVGEAESSLGVFARQSQEFPVPCLGNVTVFVTKSVKIEQSSPGIAGSGFDYSQALF
ncbi:hypothetical protein [Thalassospira xiamenensis]|uniref:hypothetical protein n=1 Tax=Thalassospira xiamenensis TaxID=220697 RepID=UPI0011BD6CE4|nr:hypothetical protein [Thalassospira xiamenensis]